MKGNDKERQRQKVEDRIIDAMDQASGKIKSPVHSAPELRVPVIDILAYKAERFGYVIKRSVVANAVISSSIPPLTPAPRVVG